VQIIANGSKGKTFGSGWNESGPSGHAAMSKESKY
jgi:hypothetical protein